MPFIDSKTTVKLTEEKKESIKQKLGRAVAILHKPESYLMVGFQDGYDLYFAGEKLKEGAYVEVSLLGSASSTDYAKMTGEICRILSEEAGIPAEHIYVTYHGLKDWGWNGTNF